jgi:selenocysteine-specific elongation factor
VNEAPLTLGTAGHVDHGKTALVGALTGVDTDRLAQERERGISIELGYALLEFPSGRRLSVIDVPGHERLVRTMVAGATGIDLFLMTVAADDGVMPQTREHAAVLAALDVRSGVVAVTKCDLADPEPAARAAATLLPDAAIVPVSARTGAGLGELRVALECTAAGLVSRAQDDGPARLHVDRVFTIRGAGTVATGTLWAGTITCGRELVLLPGGRRVRVREVQVHGEPLAMAQAGQRVAVNLASIATTDLSRGDVLVSPAAPLAPARVLDAELNFPGREPEHGERVQIHHGTRETSARMTWLGGSFWQLRLEQPLLAARGDRLVIRQIAPPDTLGGGTVLDPAARRHGPGRDALVRLERLSRSEPEPEPADAPTGGRNGRRAGGATAEPAAAPVPPLGEGTRALEARLRTAGLEPPADSELDPDDLAALRAAGRAVRVSRTLHYHAAALAETRAHVVAAAERRGGSISLAELRDELGTSRRFAQALLAHFDSERVTIRRGDRHVLRSRPEPVTPGPPAPR